MKKLLLLLAATGLMVSRGIGAAPPNTAEPAAIAPAAKEPAVELSPFEVRADLDVGYQAANTTSGSRLNSRLKDTPAAVSPFTPEFLADIAATNLQEMLGYATNIELDTEDATAGFNNPDGRSATSNDYQFRMRGMTASSARDYIESNIPIDLYNVERAEIASGPNSILFGLGAQGGLVSLTGKRANLARTRTTLRGLLGSWHYERYEADHNQVLLPNKLSVRLLGLYQNAQGWRYWDFNDQKRYTAALAYRPFKNTTVHASAEGGKARSSVLVNWNAVDAFTLWDQSGRPVANGAAVPGTVRFNQGNARYTFFEQDGRVYNLRGELDSDSRYSTQTLAPPSLVPYNYNNTGPGGIRTQDFGSFDVQVQQRLARNLVLEGAYFHNRNVVAAFGTNGQPELHGDPNLSIPLADFVTVVPNPRARQVLMDSLWFKDDLVTANDVARLSAAWEIDLGRRFGRHRIAGLLENSRQDRTRHWRNEIYVDQNGTPIANAANPEGTQNQVYRRHYLTEGDYTTYYAGNPLVPVPSFTIGTRQFQTAYVSRTKSNTDTRKVIDSAMLAIQSSWFRERLVTTLGYRRDQIEFRNTDEARVANPGDPRVTSRQVILNEWDFTGTYSKRHYQPATFSSGGVLHATRRLSLFANYSRNNGAPRFDRTVLPDGQIPPPTEGASTDIGVMLDFLGDERLFLRATHFNTTQINDASIVPNGVDVNTSNALGGDNLTNIYNALLSAGRLTQAQYDQQAVTYNAATIDVYTKGVELELVANPTRNFTLRFSYSYSERRRGRFFSEIFAYYDAKIPEWRALAANNPALLATVNNEIATLQSELNAQIDRQAAPFSSRPNKFNLTGRYKLTEGRFRGAFAGGAVRYQGRNFISTDKATGRDYWGNETMFADAFAGYRMRAPWTKGTLSLQLNVKNLTNSYLVGVGRYNDAYDGVRRVYLNDPRSYRFTTTLEF